MEYILLCIATFKAVIYVLSPEKKTERFRLIQKVSSAVVLLAICSLYSTPSQGSFHIPSCSSARGFADRSAQAMASSRTLPSIQPETVKLYSWVQTRLLRGPSTVQSVFWLLSVEGFLVARGHVAWREGFCWALPEPEGEIQCRRPRFILLWGHLIVQTKPKAIERSRGLSFFSLGSSYDTTLVSSSARPVRTWERNRVT